MLGLAGRGDRDRVAVAAHALRDPEDVDLLDTGGLRLSRHRSSLLSCVGSSSSSSASTSSSSPRITSTSRPPQRRAARAGSPRASLSAPQSRQRAGRRHVLDLQLGALERRALGHQLEGELERVGHHLAQVPDLHLDRRAPAARRRARSAIANDRTGRSRARALSRSSAAGRRRAGPSPAAAEAGLDEHHARAARS